MRLGAAGEPKPGESVSGDAYFFKELDGKMLVCVIDALGHGPDANLVAEKMVRFLDDTSTHDLSDLARRCHEELRGTRGAVASMALISEAEDHISYVGVGNVATVLVTGDDGSFERKASQLVPVGGILGYNLKKLLPFEYDYGKDASLVMFTDGITSHFDVLRYISEDSDPQRVAESILEERNKGSDDAMVVVVMR